MNKEIMDLSYAWWKKLAPLNKKFVRETWLCGYDKEDLMQECYLILIKCLEKFDRTLGVPFESYYKKQLYGWRANQNRKRRELLNLDDEIGDQMTQVPDVKVNLEVEVENKLLIEKLLKGLSLMDEIDQTIVIRYYLEDRPLKDIAKDLGLKYKAAEFRKGRALKSLKAFLNF